MNALTIVMLAAVAEYKFPMKVIKIDFSNCY